MSALQDCEKLRLPTVALTADPRSANVFGEIERQYEYIAQFKLNAAVPSAIQIHYETARNLYLYSWVVFRFFPVAESHAFSTLEFALRERLGLSINGVDPKPQTRKPGLRALLKHAGATGVLTNQRFAARERWAMKRAVDRFMHEHHSDLVGKTIGEITALIQQVKPTLADLEYDWLSTFEKTIPTLRNNYAHGSATLLHSVLWTFEVVSEIVNQLFPEERLAS